MVITCPGCNKKLAIPDTNSSHVRCQYCKTSFAIEYSEPVKITDVRVPLPLKANRFWKKHKRKIIAGTAVVAAAIAGGIIVCNKRKDSTVDSGVDFDLLPSKAPEPPMELPDSSNVTADPCATNSDDELPEEDGIDLSALEYLSFLVDNCYNCGGSLAGGEYVAPWEDGSNEYGYWICPHCGAPNEDWNSADDD